VVLILLNLGWGTVVEKYRIALLGRDPFLYAEAEIVEVEIEKEGPKCVWIKGRRYLKTSQGYSFFDTRQEAYEHILDLAERRVERARSSLQQAQDLLKRIGAMDEGK